MRFSPWFSYLAFIVATILFPSVSSACKIEPRELCADPECSIKSELIKESQLYQGGLGLESVEDLFEHLRQRAVHPIGQIEYLDKGTKTTLFAFIRNTNNGFFVIDFYFTPKRPTGALVPAYILGKFNSDANQIRFMGALVQPQFREMGLFKKGMKFFFSFVADLKADFGTEVMKKPAFAFFFTRLGLIPTTSRHKATISLSKNSDGAFPIFPHGFGIAGSLIKSQNLTLLEEPPTDYPFEIFMNTQFKLPRDASLKTLDSIRNLPGQVTLKFE